MCEQATKNYDPCDFVQRPLHSFSFYQRKAESNSEKQSNTGKGILGECVWIPLLALTLESGLMGIHKCMCVCVCVLYVSKLYERLYLNAFDQHIDMYVG